jgi:hypothetical protein
MTYRRDFDAKAASYVMEAIRWANADRLFNEMCSV